MKNVGVEFETRWAVAVGVVIWASRKAKGIVQEDLAHRSGITRGALQNIEHGRTTLGLLTFVQVCAALGEHPKDVIARIQDLASSPVAFDAALKHKQEETRTGRPPRPKG